MKVSTELTPEHQAIITVELDEEELQRALERAGQRVSRIRPVRGFRPGKAPYSRIERAFGREILLEEAVQDLSVTLGPEVLKENHIEPGDNVRVDVIQKDPPIFKYTVPLKPQVKLGDYQSIHLLPPIVEVSDQEVDQMIERFRFGQAAMVPVTRAVRKGDIVTIDVTGSIPDHPPVNEHNVRVAVSDPRQPGLPFEDQLIGMTPGETKEIIYTYPSDFADENFRDKTAHYTVTLHDIKETQLPELDDEFAKAVSQFQTLEQFRGNIREMLRRQKEFEEQSRYADQVLDILSERSEIAYPPAMLQQDIDHHLAHLKEDMKRLGLTWDKYLELAGKTEEQIREEIRPEVEKQLKRALLLNQLVATEKPEVTREEVDAEIERLVEQTERAGGNPTVARRTYTAREGRRNIEFNLQVNQVVNKLMAIARGEPFSGKILTPEMVRNTGASPIPSGLITDPNQVREADWPRGLERKA